MSASTDMISQKELNDLLGRRIFNVLKDGKLLPYTRDSIPYGDPGFKAASWDIIQHPDAFGNILRIGFTKNGEEGNPGAELKYIFLMEMK
jgi:hypothetical protein